MKWKELHRMVMYVNPYLVKYSRDTQYSWTFDKKVILRLIDLVFVASLSFARLLTQKTVKWITLNNDELLLGPKLVDQNPNKLWYYPLMASLYRYGRSCNTFEDSSDGIYITTTIN